jgi:hypothetical protein
MTRRIQRGGLLLGLLVLGACAAESNSNPSGLPPWKTVEPEGPTQTISAALTLAADCDEALAALKLKLIAEMESALEARYQDVLGQLENGCWREYDDGAMDASAADTSSPSEETSEGDEATDYTTTNTQVVDVDEADFLKNDGGYLYILAHGKLRIFDAWPAAESHLLSATAIAGTPTRLFVHKDRAIVYSSLDPIELQESQGYDDYPEALYRDCTYGYDCEFTGDGRALQITVLDLADLAAPKVTREIRFTGSYLSSRRIDDAIHTVVYFPDLVAAIPGVSTTPEAFQGWDWCEDTSAWTTELVDAAFEELHDANVALIQAADLTEQLPRVTDTRYGSGEPVVDDSLLADCAGFYVDQAGDGASLLSLTSFDLDADQPLDASTIVGRPGAVYASRQALYVAARHASSSTQGWYYEESSGVDEATTLHKFALDGAGSSYAGSGVTKGRLLNQFAMDEREGFLRVATTTGHLPSPDVHSTLSVLEPTAEGLAVVGLLDHLAPSEDIRSVRFNGDVGFIVTFKKTDPLFVLDLSDPTAPAVRGELKIPGFSTYLHLMDDDHVLAMGYDADDQGDFAWFQGILLQIFDVTVLSDPKLMHKEVIGTRGSTSEAATNHLAFTYFKARDLLAVPMTICEGGSGGSFGDLMTFSGLLVYDVTLEDGFTRVGGVPHAVPETEEDYSGACSSWWTDSNSVVKRSVFLDDWVFSVADDVIKVASVGDLEHPVTSLPLTD